MNADRRSGFTLIEVLAATALTLLIMAATVQLFAKVSGDISRQRGTIETGDRLRATQERLSRDLRWRTAPTLPPLNPRDGKGYLEIKEGPANGIGGLTAFVDEFGNPDQTIADHNDVLMFTARSDGEPFVGKFGAITAQSQIAEIAWFVRGTTLYRRVLLVAPGYASSLDTAAPIGIVNSLDYTGSFYSQYDLSAHQEGGAWDLNSGSGAQRIQLNTLADLTKRENRFAHQGINAYNTVAANIYNYPHGINQWGEMGLPTLFECSDPTWPFPLLPTTAAYTTSGNSIVPSVLWPGNFPVAPQAAVAVDLWNGPYLTSTGTNRYNTSTGIPSIEPTLGNLTGFSNGTRVAEDVILTNVIGFDIKVWDPSAPLFSTTLPVIGVVAVGPGDNNYGALLTAFIAGGAGAPALIGRGAYVDIGYAGSTVAANAVSQFSGPGYNAATLTHFTYDTWSSHYEGDGIDQNGDVVVDSGTDGIDNVGSQGGVDDPSELEAPAPYPFPLRGIQIKVRVFERDSRQVRETTLVTDFMPE